MENLQDGRFTQEVWITLNTLDDWSRRMIEEFLIFSYKAPMSNHPTASGYRAKQVADKASKQPEIAELIKRLWRCYEQTENDRVGFMQYQTALAPLLYEIDKDLIDMMREYFSPVDNKTPKVCFTPIHSWNSAVLYFPKKSK